MNIQRNKDIYTEATRISTDLDLLCRDIEVFRLKDVNGKDYHKHELKDVYENLVKASSALCYAIDNIPPWEEGQRPKSPQVEMVLEEIEEIDKADQKGLYGLPDQ